MSNLSIRIPESVKKELRRFCKRRGKSASEVTRDSLRRYMAVEEFRELRAKTLPYAKAQGYLTDEDVFRAIS
jgi:Arc/MetJ-type ribon-helix-helix transcriptional regulator